LDLSEIYLKKQKSPIFIKDKFGIFTINISISKLFYFVLVERDEKWYICPCREGLK